MVDAVQLVEVVKAEAGRRIADLLVEVAALRLQLAEARKRSTAAAEVADGGSARP